MTLRKLLLLFIASILPVGVMAKPPQLYTRPDHESPVRGDPDDLLFLAGDGFAANDTVVYRALVKQGESFATPRGIPTRSTADVGVAPVVSAADIPYSLTVRLPQDMRADQTYAFWVRNAAGEWSKPVEINDARPLWSSPAYAYVSGMPAGLPRELKIVGRNLQPGPGLFTHVRLIGPQQFTGAAVSDAGSSNTLNVYVARVPLPRSLSPGRYRIQVNRDGATWVDVHGQSFDVLPDPPAAAEFSVSDPRFGGCRADDGLDDTACIVRAIAAAKLAGGGSVSFGPGTWDLIDGGQPGLTAAEGILVAAGVRLLGAGNNMTRLARHADWNQHAAAAFTLAGHTLVRGFTFRDLQVYRPGDRAASFLQVGENWQRVASSSVAAEAAAVSDVVITGNTFDKVFVAIGSGGVPIDRLFITNNTFGAYRSALELSGDQYDTLYKFRLDDSVIDHNVFDPGGWLDLVQKAGTVASEIGAGHRVDFSGNTADGASTRYLEAPDDARGWRAAFFWNLNDNVEDVLVSQNTATCTGDKIGDGEAIALDNNTNTFAFTKAATVTAATPAGFTVAASLASRQHDRDVQAASYYLGHWVQVVSGPGLGQARKITRYTIDPATHATTFMVAPDWDVAPAPGRTRVAVGRAYWHFYAIDNLIDNRQPLCQKSNRSRLAAGHIVLWAQSADSVIAGNRQYDSDGIFVQQNYVTAEHPCAACTMEGYFHSFLEIRDNTIDGEYAWGTDCSVSGIVMGTAAAPWGEVVPSTVGFGISISHNTIRHADNQHGGAIAQASTWFAGPEPHRWPLSDNLLIYHNSISDIDGARSLAICEGSRPRIGIAFPDPPIAWRTVLYANSCKNVSMPIGPGGVDTVKVCPSPVPDSCECQSTPP